MPIPQSRRKKLSSVNFYLIFLLIVKNPILIYHCSRFGCIGFVFTASLLQRDALIIHLTDTTTAETAEMWHYIKKKYSIITWVSKPYMLCISDTFINVIRKVFFLFWNILLGAMELFERLKLRLIIIDILKMAPTDIILIFT